MFHVAALLPNGHVIGALWFHDFGSVRVLSPAGVVPQFWGRGVGRKMFLHAFGGIDGTTGKRVDPIFPREDAQRVSLDVLFFVFSRFVCRTAEI